jgi:hypothetical protein
MAALAPVGPQARLVAAIPRVSLARPVAAALRVAREVSVAQVRVLVAPVVRRRAARQEQRVAQVRPQRLGPHRAVPAHPEVRQAAARV